MATGTKPKAKTHGHSTLAAAERCGSPVSSPDASSLKTVGPAVIRSPIITASSVTALRILTPPNNKTHGVKHAVWITSGSKGHAACRIMKALLLGRGPTSGFYTHRKIETEQVKFLKEGLFLLFWTTLPKTNLHNNGIWRLKQFLSHYIVSWNWTFKVPNSSWDHALTEHNMSVCFSCKISW